MNTRQWLVSVISYYRNLGFFQQYPNLSDEQIADILENIQKKNQFGDGTFNSQKEEDVIVLDETRIIPIYLEEMYSNSCEHKEGINIIKSVSEAQNIIEGILLELSYIARDVFTIKNIKCYLV
ncbi:hypothetical protein [Crocosphaera chwakensis]|uniref:Uncharacterized protein n=1 Tax=Crocosphaera chwakensis CCY0110 TaxID=391612 RepID=A3IMU3_9CHRO|nr:hypothetical protein [Crocosphaera chwakensis]EAZ92196.1 hypothetical protein CY0110_24836 [Crocosphaera chwakensis CCY0110]